MGADIVIAVSLQGIMEEKKDPTNIISIAERSIDIMIADLTTLSLIGSDLIIEPKYQGEVSFLMGTKEREAIIEQGEIEAKKHIASIKEAIDGF